MPRERIRQIEKSPFKYFVTKSAEADGRESRILPSHNFPSFADKFAKIEKYTDFYFEKSIQFSGTDFAKNY